MRPFVTFHSHFRSRLWVIGAAMTAACASPARPPETPPDARPEPADASAVVVDLRAEDAALAAADASRAEDRPADAADADVDPDSAERPIVYPAGAVHSPITAAVAERLRAIARLNPGRNDRTFMKAGDAISQGREYLGCVGAGPPTEDLGAYGSLQPTIAYFAGGDIAGQNPFLRDSQATRESLTAWDALAGHFIEQEMAAANPRYALVMFGGVDIGEGGTFTPSPLIDGLKFKEHGQALWSIADQLIAGGVVPILRSMAPRTIRGVPVPQGQTFRAIQRGIAQGRRIPFIDFYGQMENLPSYGLADDGLHINSYVARGAGARCVYTDAGLKFGYDLMNLLSLQALARAKQVVADGAPALDATADAPAGDGSLDSPFQVGVAPFTDMRDLAAAPTRPPGARARCAQGPQEGGAYAYRWDLTTPVRARAVLIDRKGSPVDTQLHHFVGAPTAASCQASDTALIEKTFAAGTHHFVVDAPTSPTGRGAEYLLVIVACTPEDDTCN
jgi:hypothetical protein